MTRNVSSFLTVTSFTFLVLGLSLALAVHAQVTSAMRSEPSDSDDWLESAFTTALRQELLERGVGEGDIDNLLYAVGVRLLQQASTRNIKRAGWKRIPIQARFAPFGTKLVPSRNHGDSNGPTLLRYGRSIAA